MKEEAFGQEPEEPEPERGRPPLYGETMIQTGVRLPREQAEWLKTKPEGISEYLRVLIAREMEAEQVK